MITTPYFCGRGAGRYSAGQPLQCLSHRLPGGGAGERHDGERVEHDGRASIREDRVHASARMTHVDLLIRTVGGAQCKHRVGFAEASLTDAEGRVYASATSTLLVLGRAPGSAKE